jgi:hypothetical protein
MQQYEISFILHERSKSGQPAQVITKKVLTYKRDVYHEQDHLSVIEEADRRAKELAIEHGKSRAGDFPFVFHYIRPVTNE